MKKLAPVAASGDHLETLKALRDRLAQELDATFSARDVASLAARLAEVLDEIAELTPDDPKEDDLAKLLALPGAN